MGTILTDLVYLSFHAAMAALGAYYFHEEDRCRLPGVPLFLMASGALHVAWLLIGMASGAGGGGGSSSSRRGRRRSPSAVPPVLVLLCLAAGARLATLQVPRWRSARGPSDDGYCDSAPMLAAHISMAVQAALLVVAVFRALALVMGALLLVVVVAGVVTSSGFPFLAVLTGGGGGAGDGEVAGTAGAAEPEFYPQSLKPEDIL